LGLPDDASIDLTVVPATGGTVAGDHSNGNRRPAAPTFSAAELAARLSRHAVSVGSLPIDFSRADIYRDHD